MSKVKRTSIYYKDENKELKKIPGIPGLASPKSYYNKGDVDEKLDSVKSEFDETISSVETVINDEVFVEESGYDYIDLYRMNSNGGFTKQNKPAILYVPAKAGDVLWIFPSENQFRIGFYSEFSEEAVVKGTTTIINRVRYANIGEEATFTAPEGTLYCVLSESADRSIINTINEGKMQATLNGKDITVKKVSRIAKINDKLNALAEKIDVGTDIVKLNDEAIMTSLLVQSKSNRKTKEEKNTSGTEVPNLTLIHCSDIHGNAENVKRLIQFRNHYSEYINDIIHTGDTVQYAYANGIDDIKAIEGFETVLNTVGNHDNCDMIDGASDFYARTSKECYDLLLKDYISNWGVVYTPDVCDYYKDYADYNVRLIVLDCMHHTTEQDSWLTSTLNEAKTLGYHVIIAKHYCMGQIENKVDNCAFSNDAIVTSGSMNYSGIVKEFINNGGMFVCWLVGHSHAVDFGYDKNHPEQLVLNAPTVSYNRSGVEADRVVGTKSQDAFFLVTIDTDHNWLKVIMVGADRDRLLRSRKTMCYDYKAHKLLSSN